MNASIALPLPDIPPDQLALLLGAVTFLSFCLLWFALLERDTGAKRARRIAQVRRELARNLDRSPKRQFAATAMATASRVANALRLAQSSSVEQFRERLTAAGLRSREALAVFLVAKLVLPLAGGMAGWIGLTLAEVEGSLSTRLVLLLSAVVAGFYLPELFVSRLAARRRARLQKAVPDALDLLVICAEAGLSLDTALNRVSEELLRAAPELSEELALTSVELALLPDRRQALHNLAKRVPIPTIRAVVSTLIQTERYGTPLAASLRVLANELREQRIIRAEEKAARLPAILTVPLIAFILPALFVVLAGQAMIDIADYLAQQ